METKKLIKEKLEFHKRQSVAYEMLNKTANHIYDAYRTLEMACQYCDNPLLREKLEELTTMIGKTNETAGYVDDEMKTVISKLQEVMKDFKS